MSTEDTNDGPRKTLMVMPDCHAYLTTISEKSDMGRHLVVEALCELVPEAQLLSVLAAKRKSKLEERATRAEKATSLRKLASRLSIAQLEALLAQLPPEDKARAD